MFAYFLAYLLCCVEFSVAVAVDQTESIELCDRSAADRFCFSIYHIKKAFLDANDHCETAGKSLLTINTKKQQEFVIASLRNVTPQTDFWFGLHSTADRYEWMSGQQAVPNTYVAPALEQYDIHCFSINAGQPYTWTRQFCNSKLWFLCGEKFSPPVSESSVSTDIPICPLGYELFGRSCFMAKAAPTDKLNWSSAWASCSKSAADATLATVSSLLEQDFLSILLVRFSGPSWIGMHTVNEEHRWLDGQEITFTNWMPNQPAYVLEPQCTMMHQRPRHFSKWEDVSCKTELNYMCEAPPIGRSPRSTPVLPIPFGQGGCNTSFIEFRGRCYRIESQLTNQTTSSTAALDRRLCPVRLAPHSPEEHAFMRVLMHLSFSKPASYAWVGLLLPRNPSERSFFNLKAEDGLPVSTASALDFSLLPFDADRTNDHCFAISSAKTNLFWLNCSTALPSICGYSLPHYVLYSPSAIRCPTDWIQFGRKCFSTVQNTRRTWSDAESRCASMQPDSHLVSLHSPAEQHFLSNLLNNRHAWLGLRVQLHAGNNHTLLYQWSDDSIVDYLSFGIGQPSFEFNNGALEECVVLQDGTHDWNDVACYDRHIYVCQLVLSSDATIPSPDLAVPPKSSPERLCTVDPLNQNICIQFHGEPHTFIDAEMTCRSHNATLLTILNKEYQLFAEQILRNLSRGSAMKAYIGLFSSQDVWLWTSSYHSLSSAYWSPGHPNPTEPCVYLDSSANPLHTWKSGSCDAPLPFLCSTPPPTIDSSHTNLSNFVCPANFTRLDYGCFLVNATIELTWEEASTTCAKLAPNGTLATLRSPEDQDRITAILGLTKSSAWIGLRLLNNIKQWTNNAPIRFTNWGPGQPVGQGTRCVFIEGNSNQLGGWRDDDCSLRKGFVCQADPIPIDQPSALPAADHFFQSGRCMRGFYEYRNRCLSLSPVSSSLTRSVTEQRDEISTLCLNSTTSKCGTPISPWGTVHCPVATIPHTLADVAFMRTMVRAFGSGSTEAWVGLKLNFSTGQFQLISEDGAAPRISRLQISKSDLTAYQSSVQRFACVVLSIRDDQLALTNCTNVGVPVLCSYYLDNLPSDQQNIVPLTWKCPSDWIFVRGKCFRFTGDHTRLSWEDAEKECQSLSQGSQSGHLASIHSLDDQHLLSELAPASSYWIGLSASFVPAAPFSQHIPLRFAWSDYSPLDYLAISPEPFESTEEVKHCFSVDGSNVLWQSSECYQLRPFVCQLTSGLPMGSDVKTSVVDVSNVSSKASNSMFTCDPHFPLKPDTGSSCYRLFNISMDWASAEAVCRNLHTDAHLASVHSMRELNQLAALLSNKTRGDIWIGLYETQLAYAWSDNSPVNFIPLSADRSKDNRHLLQDCFVLSLSTETNSTLLKAIDCTSTPPAFICQHGTSAAPSDQAPLTYTFIQCPPGYRQYGDRCFSVSPQLMSWNDGNRTCGEQAMAFHGYSGSLVRIDNALVQDFVSSLLDALPAKSSSAWIGLQRSMSDDSPQFRWADTENVTFLRSVYRAQNVPIVQLEHPGNASDNNASLTSLPRLCTALYRSTYPRLNGLWLQWSCEETILLPSICQAVPPAGMDFRIIERDTGFGKCPAGFYLGTTGLFKSAANLTGPVCYRLLSATETFNWKGANEGCRALSREDVNVSLLSIGSVFEASFLRSWLQLPRTVGGAELLFDTPVWSALRVLADCPDCYRNWTWATVQPEPVRYTDWLIPPSPSPRGCYVFIADPYRRQDAMTVNGLGSIQLAQSCEVTHFTVCQASVIKEGADNRSSLAPPHQLTRSACSRIDWAASANSFVSTNVMSRTGKPCLRWDLIPMNMTDFRLESNWMRHRVHTYESIGGDGNPSYAENFCSLRYNAQSENFDYGCYVQLEPPFFEVCDLSYCKLPYSPHTRLLSPALITSLFSLLVISVVVLAIATWRGCLQHARSGYRRLFTPAPFQLKGARASMVQFMPPDTLSGLPSQELGGLSRNVGRHNQRLNFDPPGPLNSQPLTTDPTLPSTCRLTSSHAAAPLMSVTNGLNGYSNPIYNPISPSAMEDDYDPEAEL